MSELPPPWTDEEIAQKSFEELRARLTIYATEAERLEELYNQKTAEFNAREASYVKIFGRLAVINETRDILFGKLLNTKSLAADETLADAIALTSLTAGAGLGIKTLLYLDKLNDLRVAGRTIRETAAIVQATGGAANTADLAAKATANARKIKSIRVKSAGFGLLTLGLAVATYVRAKQTEAEAETQMRDAFPEYLEFFTDVNAAIDELQTGIDTMNTEIAAIVAETGVGSEATLLTYLEGALGQLGTFRALYDAAIEMIQDRDNPGSNVDLTNADIAKYTGLPVDYIDTLAELG